MVTATSIIMADEATSSAALYRLMAWLSPSYPVGAFSYSSGIEWAVEAGDIKDAESLRRWLAVVIGEGGGFCDAVFFVHAHRAAILNDDAALRAVAELAAAFSPSKERHLETTAQGRAFLDTTRAAWPTPSLDRLTAVWDGAVALPIAVGVASAGHGIALAPALHAYLHAITAKLTGSAFLRRSSRSRRRPPRARSSRRSIRSAGRRSAPISPACATKPNTHGCSGLNSVVMPANAGVP